MWIKHDCEPFGMVELRCLVCDLTFLPRHATYKGHIWNSTLLDYNVRLKPYKQKRHFY